MSGGPDCPPFVNILTGGGFPSNVIIVPAFMKQNFSSTLITPQSWLHWHAKSREAAGSFTVPFGPGRKTGIQPYVIDWPIATDGNGQSYPSGIVGVLHNYDYSLSYADNFDPALAYNANESLFGGPFLALNNLRAVPDTLDLAEYSPRWERDYNQIVPPSTDDDSVCRRWDRGQSAPMGGMSSNAEDLKEAATEFLAYRIRGLDTLTEYFWMPESFYAYDDNAAAVTYPPGTQGSTGRTTGFRYLRLIVTGGASIAGTYRIKRNDVLPYDVANDVTIWSDHTAGGGGDYDTGYMAHNGTTQDWYAHDHKRCVFNYYFQPDAGSESALLPNIVRSGPRVDIPLPYLATDDTRVVPGGIWIGAGVPGFA